MTDLFDAISAGDLPQVKAILASDPGAIHQKNNHGQGAITVAIYSGESEIAEWLAQSTEAQVSFHERCALGHLHEVEQELTLHDWLINEFSVDGFQPLGLAAFFGRVDVAELLIQHGADVNTASHNPMKVCPLHSAVAGKHLQISTMLLNAGADVNAVQQDGYTPLHAAAANGQIEMIQLLLSFGADRTARLDNGRTPRQLAMENGHLDSAALLTA